MPFRARLLWVGCALLFTLRAEPRYSFHVVGKETSGWPELLSSMGLISGDGGGAGLIVAPHGTDLPSAEWGARVEHGVVLVLEGESALAAAFGFRAFRA